MQILEFRFKQAAQPLSDLWQHLPIGPRHSTLLGISFRPLQAKAFGLDPLSTLNILLAYPFQLIRLGAYWKQIETKPGAFDTSETDWQVEAAEKAGKQIILCVGPVKTFGYPEFFVPQHQLAHPFPEGRRVTPKSHSALLEGSIAFINQLIERYKGCQSILGWQVEHEAADPLGVEHSWRLDFALIKQEVEAVRKADPTRPVMMNGFLPTSTLVRLSQWWRTRDQGDSLAVAQRLADWVGIDYYPRNALLQMGSRTLYLDGSQSAWLKRKREKWIEWAHIENKRLLVAEGQAEPWEAVTTPPNPNHRGMYSCLPEHLITNYNDWIGIQGLQGALHSYLLWGAEYWVVRKQGGDASYLEAFERILEKS